ncbi:MAG: dTDP-4-dehydrorhamnose 3,5-epimerase [Flavobacteriales bacterium]|nr:dTDP-4-dehydrorhamnose 3,5-epimerase [Flavobacteriales bacterium]
MNFVTTEIEGLLIVEPRVFADERGYFFESYNKRLFDEAGLNVTFVQDNQSLSQKGVLRGLHFQEPPHAQAKLVSVVKGSVLDVAVDIRKDSPTYGKHCSLILSEENKKMFFIPKGFAHGFLTLEDNTIFSYKCSDFYAKDSEGGILWNDQHIGIDWGISDPILSDKDQVAQAFSTFKSPF